MATTPKPGNGRTTHLPTGGAAFELPPDEVIFGESSAMREVQQKIEKLCATNLPVLVQGESGTGKEIIAQILHQRSPSQSGPFVKVNCPAIPGTLLESELFGYERGAFTGAHGSKPGRVELAHGGSLFLDEIADLDAGLQAKLLQLLQDGQFYSVGGQKEKKVDVRVICATNRNLADDIDSGTFRQDLFYRINVVNITLPALRHRKNDIPILIAFLLQAYNQRFYRKAPMFSQPTLTVLEKYSWPGNIRELENLIKRYVILGSEEAVVNELLQPNRVNKNGKPNGDGAHLLDGSAKAPSGPAAGAAVASLRDMTQGAMRDFEGKIILKTLQDHQWNRRRAARALKISYRALLYKMKRSGVGSSRPLADSEGS